MGTLFLGLFVAAEIALVVLTCTKFREKAAWLKNRAFIRTAELVLLLGIILVPTTNFKWRFFGALAVIAVRSIFALIMWLAKRKRAEGNKKIGWSVVNCIMSFILVSVSLMPAFIFTNYNGLPLSGEYKVNETSAILVDENRKDEFENDGSFREVPAHFFYPETESGNFPLIVFSHGAFGYYQSNFSTYMELASNGYVVVALDHPHHSFFTEDTDGQTVIVDSTFIEDVMKLSNGETSSLDKEVFDIAQSWLKLRVDDENFVIDTIEAAKDSKTLSKAWHTENAKTILGVLAKTDTNKIGLVGHSLGGATGVTVGRQRKDIDAVIDLDGTMFGEIVDVKNRKNVYYTEPYPVPVLDFTKEKDYNDREQYKKENGFAYVNEYVMKNAKEGKTVTFSNVEHMDFTDLPLISPFIGSMLGHGDVDSEKCMTTVNGIVLNWFDYYLKNKGKLDIQAKY